MSEHTLRELTAAYALDALDAAEREQYERHLEACETCREELRAYREALGALPALVDAPAPPAGMRARVLERVLADDAGLGTAPAGADGETVHPEDRPGVMVLDGPSRGEQTRRASRPVLPWLAAAAGVVLAVMAGMAYLDADSERERLTADYADALEQIEQLRGSEAQLDSLRQAVLAAQLETATLVATDQAPRIRLFRDPQTGVTLVAAADLPAAPAGRTYQLWGLPTDGAPVSLGVFDPDTDGTAVRVLNAAAGQSFSAGAVSEEPAGGSPQPTTQPFLLGNWSAGE